MKPRRTHESNAVFHLSGGTEDNDLWVCRDEETIASVWEPSPEERRAIAEGANIELVVWGSGTPPVALGVTTVALGKAPTDGAEG